MITKKINERILQAYVNAATDGKHKAMTYGTYIFGTTFLMSMTSHAGGGDIFTVFEGIIDDISSRILPISSAAAVIGVGTGAFMKKFSLGKGDRIETGNKIMVNSIWGWVILNGTQLILNYFTGKGIT
jgi:hypothetical protein